MTLPRYPAYKDSGVEWLGEVPVHWSTARIKDTTYLKGRVGWKGLTSDEYLDKGYAYLVTGTDFTGRWINWRECHFVDQPRYEDDPFIQLKNGDLLITKDGTIGKIALVRALDRPACLNSGIFLVRPQRLYITDYMYWVLSSMAFSIFNDLLSVGSTIRHLYQNVFERFVFPIPTAEEQQIISFFLDRETSKIDALVAEQQNLIALLKEKRRAAISHAVTKGLNPDVPMKDSGVEWLGEVPEHWVAMPIRFAARLESGHTPSRSRPEYWENCTVAWFTLGDVWQIRDNQVERVAETKELISELGLANSSARRLPKNTVMLSRTASVGFSAIMDTEMATTQDFANWICGSSLLPEFLLFVFRSMQQEFSRLKYGSTHNTIYMPDIQALRFALPPTEEQHQVVNHIREETGRLNSLISEAESTIALLQERRSALISAAVTGKIDVRNRVAQEAA